MRNGWRMKRGWQKRTGRAVERADSSVVVWWMRGGSCIQPTSGTLSQRGCRRRGGNCLLRMA